jgi:hypothetical protein
VTPDIIDDIAKDFRLGVVQKSWNPTSALLEEGDTQRAAKTLLDLYTYLQKSSERGAEGPVPITRVRKQ